MRSRARTEISTMSNTEALFLVTGGLRVILLKSFRNWHIIQGHAHHDNNQNHHHWSISLRWLSPGHQQPWKSVGRHGFPTDGVDVQIVQVLAPHSHPLPLPPIHRSRLHRQRLNSARSREDVSSDPDFVSN